MQRLWGCFILCMILFGLSSCKEISEEVTPAESLLPVSTQVQVTPTAKAEGLLLRDRIDLLSFGQGDSSCCYTTNLVWEQGKVPSEAIEIPYQMEEIYLSATYPWLKDIEDKLMKDSIKVSGDVYWELTPNPNYGEGFKLRFLKPAGTFTIQIADLHEIKFVPRKLIEYQVLHESGEKQTSLLIQGRHYGSQLFIPTESNTVTLAFVEEMQTGSLPLQLNGTPVEADWLDSKHLRIPIVNMETGIYGSKELRISLESLRAMSNVNLGVDRSSLTVRQLPDIEWRDSISGAPVGFSPRVRFYQQLIVSPDRQSYIGVVPIGGAFGDGDGIFYSFVLERPDHEPVIIENEFLSTIEPFDLPVQWMDHNRILYASYDGVNIYDIAKGEKLALRDTEGREQRNINYAVYDSSRKQIHVLSADDGKQTNMFDLFTYEDGQSTPKQTKNFTSSVLIQKYSMMDMTISPTKTGTYWTVIEDGIPYTEFINHSGKKLKTDGYIRAIGDSGVYLERFKAGEVLESLGYSYWQPGKNAEVISKLPEYNSIFANGSDLIIQFDSKFFFYNPVTRKWVPWKVPGGEKEAVPVRGANGLYYVSNELSFGGLTIGSTEAEIMQIYGESFTEQILSDGKKSLSYQDSMSYFELENGKLTKANWSPTYINQTTQANYEIPIKKSDIDLTKDYEVNQVSCYHTAVCNNYVFTNKEYTLEILMDWSDKLIDRVTLELIVKAAPAAQI